MVKKKEVGKWTTEVSFDGYLPPNDDNQVDGNMFEFENKFNGVTEKTSFSGDAHKNVEIIFMNPDDPDNGNIMLRGKETEFEITGFSSSPSETAESLRKIL